MKFSPGSFSILALVTALLPIVAIHGRVNAGEKPNIVFIMADDLGSGDLGCYNPASKIPTPHMDAVAKAGMRFSDAHSPSAVCTPTRYGVLTGRYAWRTRLKNGVCWGYSKSLVTPGRETVASVLKSQGYHTACVGKWHLGFQAPDLTAEDYPSASSILPEDHPHAVDYSQPLTPGPNDFGFDYFFGIPASLDMDPYVYVENDRPLQLPTATVAKSAHRRQNGGGFWRGGKVSPDFRHIDVLPKTAEKAVEWLLKQKADQPFFLYFPLSAPHTPWLPTDTHRGKAKAGYYGDFVNQCDAVVGQVMAALEKTGQVENTLLIVTSDNGSHWVPGDIPKYSHRANLHYRGQKADIWEGGHRVPFVVRWPAVVKAGTQSDQTICLTDLFRTVVELSGAKVSDDAGEDSFSFVGALKARKSGSDRDSIIHHSVNGTFAVRVGDWKLIEGNLGSGGFSAPRVVKPEAGKPAGQLYNLKDDPSEANNVWEKHPQVVERLLAELNKTRDSGHSR
ncbi:MAG: arylsulfatase [Planctomycetota bacterium]|nr:arylsulfatase [Planctomycetota bacterium]